MKHNCPVVRNIWHKHAIVPWVGTAKDCMWLNARAGTARWWPVKMTLFCRGHTNKKKIRAKGLSKQWSNCERREQWFWTLAVLLMNTACTPVNTPKVSFILKIKIIVIHCRENLCHLNMKAYIPWFFYEMHCKGFSGRINQRFTLLASISHSLLQTRQIPLTLNKLVLIFSFSARCLPKQVLLLLVCFKCLYLKEIVLY